MENIILTGYMGCGKTTVGKHIAKRLGYTFVDTDEMIVEQQHRSINEIFADDGEAAFRVMETELLKQMIDAKRDHMVIASGGGMPIREENRRLLAVLGRVVYLKASPETIYGRVKEDTARPLLQCENPMKRIEEMLAIREPLYEAGAAVVVDVDGLRQAETASEIIERCRLK